MGDNAESQELNYVLQQAELAAAPITISRQRKEAVDFSVPFMSFGTTIIVKKPEDGGDPPIEVRDGTRP